MKYLDARRIRGTAAERLALTEVTNQTNLVNTGGLGTTYNLTNHGTTPFADSSKSGFGQVVNISGSNPGSNDPATYRFLNEGFTAQNWVGSGNYCLGAWAKLTDNGGDQEIFEVGTTGSGVYNYIKFYHWSANKFKCIVYVDSGSHSVMESTNDNANDGAWHHFMIERSGGTHTFYIDGVADQTWSNSGTFISFDRIRLGRYWEGQIDDAFFLTRATTSAEKTSMQTSEVKDISSMFSDSDLKLYYDCNGTSVYPNLPAGTIFEQTNDYKYYIWDGTSTWTVMVAN